MPTADPTVIDIDQHPGHLIRRLHQIAVGVFVQETSATGVTPVQYAALQVVHNQPGIDQRTLARALALDASTTGGVVDRLETRGWLARRVSPEDRRTRLLFLTPDGARGLADTLPAVERAQAHVLAPLTDRQRTEFMHLLTVLVTQNNALSRAPGDSPVKDGSAPG